MPLDNEITDWQEISPTEEPDDWVEITPVSAKDEGTSLGSKAMSVGSGLGQGATLGFGDEASALFGATILDPLLTEDKRPFIERYREGIDFARKQNEKAKNENSGLYGAGEFTGAVASSAIPAGQLAKLGKAGTAGASLLGAGRVAAPLIGSAIEAAPIGLAYGAGSSNADLLGGDVGGFAKDTALGGALGAGGGVAAKGLGMAAKPIGQKISQVSDDVTNFLTRKPTASAEKVIGKHVDKLETTQAAPEAKILKDLASDVGTPEGIAKRESALMSPLTREDRNAQFFQKTKNVYNSVLDDFKNYESNIRFKEAAENLKSVPADSVKQNLNELTVKVGGIADEIANNPDLYDASVGKHINRVFNQLRDDIYNPSSNQTSADMYIALNDAKKRVSDLAKYGKEIGPRERETINLVQQIKNEMTGALENPQVFGEQANRHREINQAYNKFLTSLENMQGKFTQAEAAASGRPVHELSSTSIGTYSRQLDTIHGADRKRYLDEMLSHAKGLAGEIDKSPLATGQSKATEAIAGYMPEKDAFVKDMTLSNQLRRIRSSKGADNLASLHDDLGRKAAGEVVSNLPVPGSNIAGSLIKRQPAQPDVEQMIRQLLDKEKQQKPSAIHRGANFFGEKISTLAQTTPQIFGRFAPALQNAAQRGAAAVSAVNHVLLQQSEEYRNIQKKLENNNEDLITDTGQIAQRPGNIQ